MAAEAAGWDRGSVWAEAFQAAEEVPVEQEARVEQEAAAQAVLEAPEVDRAAQWMPAICGALPGRVVAAAAELQEQGVAMEAPLLPLVDSLGPVVHPAGRAEKEHQRLGGGSRRRHCFAEDRLPVASAQLVGEAAQAGFP